MEPFSALDASTDVFSFPNDDELSQRLQFIKEIGCGNWGSVWLCEPKSSDVLASADPFDRTLKKRLAVKLVHRDKESKTSAARVKSLWNEMKIVRKLKTDPHPSIIPFYSFLLTPSYAIITMAYHPELVTVQVSEPHARVWFRYLLSAVEFLHRRGIVHNDIKPANILLSSKGVPVLCDFGFAEAYDLKSDTAFHSKFAYGTPEYLAPERARGIPHDTRKSDVWSLGITFFEILIGRTPFEESDQDQCITEEDLQKYWSRTLRGKWVGTWKMSKGIEGLVKRMLSPNADLRCTASEAMKDVYWVQESGSSHRRSSSYTSTIVFEKDMSKLMEPSSPRIKPSPSKQEILNSPPGLYSPKSEDAHPQRTIMKSKSQPKVAGIKVAQTNARKRVPVPPVGDLSPIKASPLRGQAHNGTTVRPAHKPQRQPLGAINSQMQSNVRPAGHRLAGKPSVDEIARKRKGRMLEELAGPQANRKGKGKENHVSQRVRDWERERERLREMSRLEEIERERDAETEQEEVVIELAHSGHEQKLSTHPPNETSVMQDLNRSVVILTEPSTPAALAATASSTCLPEVVISPANTPPRTQRAGPGRPGFKHAIRKSIDKTLNMYKISPLGHARTQSRTLSVEHQTDMESRGSHSERESWENDPLVREAKSSLPVVRHAIHNEQIAADNRVDRLTLWMRNVEQVVEDARQNFTVGRETPLPPLPLPPASRSSSSRNRSNRSSRLPRKVLAANEIFSDQSMADQSVSDGAMSSFVTSGYTSPTTDAFDSKISQPTDVLSPTQTPARQRRATVSTRSPEPVVSAPYELEEGSPSKRKEKSKSHGNLFQLHIAPAAALGAELDKVASPPASSPRLSAIVDRNVFIAPPVRSREDVDRLSSSPANKSADELTSSPLHVEPYAARPRSALEPIPDTPTQRRVEGVYDRFLMATSGVKRLGKGYESDNFGPIHNTISHPAGLNLKQSHRAFYSVRKPMPPPVSSEDQRRTVSVDELGVMSCSPGAGKTILKDENNTVTLVRRAIKAIVPGKTVARRVSRVN